ncbi:hypothetical protein [Natrinema marinum]|uniref:hypothetical protein n=1 Tax=Natrinema marinum TaxID=2961598 RepID=UPI0020C84D73|nr:hypothetical protein [Natrinema marinum]
MTSTTDSVRVWLVERGYTNRDLVILQYATPDGEGVYRRELAPQALEGATVTAAKDVSPSDLEAADEADVQRYADEAARMAEEHEPDDEI